MPTHSSSSPVLPLPLGPWQAWAQRANELLSDRLRSAADVAAVFDMAKAIHAPIPERLDWLNLAHRGGFPASMHGSILELLVFAGHTGLYGSSFGHFEAVAQLGELLLDKGAAPTSTLIPLALLIGLGNLDGPGRLEACVRWGATPIMDKAAALCACALSGKWHKPASQACWNRLIELGAMDGPHDWTSCPQDRHPLVAALKARDVAAFQRGLDAGVGSNWTDPVSGATLWHFACGAGTALAKSIVPLLVPRIPLLADVACHGAETFGNDHAVSASPGQTPLHLASSWLEVPAMLTLLSLQANPNALDAHGRAPLHFMARKHGAKAQSKSLLAARALIDHGANPGLAMPDGRTAAQIMASKAPLGALDALLSLRPGDIASDEPHAKKALAALSKRGPAEVSLAERVVFETLSKPDAPTPSKRKSRL